MRCLGTLVMVATAAAVLLLAPVPAAAAVVGTKEKKGSGGPFQRFQTAAGEREDKAAGAEKPKYKHDARRALAAAGTQEKIQFLQGIMKNGPVDPIEMFTAVIDSEVFQQKILGNVEIQHRLLEEMPILHAIPGFADVRGRRLSDEETTAGFAKGIKTMLEYTKTAQKIKDPDYVFGIVAELSKSTDPEIQEIFKGLRAQDEAAHIQIRDIVGEKLFPGVDIDKLKELRDNANFDKLLSFKELDRFIDQDPYISNIFRKPHP